MEGAQSVPKVYFLHQPCWTLDSALEVGESSAETVAKNKVLELRRIVKLPHWSTHNLRLIL